MRVGVGVGWGGYYGGGYYGSSYYGGGVVYSAPVVRNCGPRFVHYPPRVVTYPVPPIEQVIPEPVPPRPIIKLKPGESIERGNVVIANIDGKIVILQAVDNDAE